MFSKKLDEEKLIDEEQAVDELQVEEQRGGESAQITQLKNEIIKDLA